jgi:hypothetical protein
MKTQKMSLANIQGKLSRDEMKKIMAGSTGCSTGPCTVYNNGTTYSGTCGRYDFGGGYSLCECKTSLGIYTPSSGQSHCVV